MNLYLISQSENNDYDTFDSAVVAADSEEAARLITPGDEHSWVSNLLDHVAVRLLGVAVKGTKPGIILASFNAG